MRRLPQPRNEIIYVKTAKGFERLSVATALLPLESVVELGADRLESCLKPSVRIGLTGKSPLGFL